MDVQHLLLPERPMSTLLTQDTSQEQPNMAHKTTFIDPGVLDYIQAHSLRDSPLLAELRAETAGLDEARMQVPAEQGQFLALLVQATGAKNCLEIGTFTGYSALSIALALPPDGRLICCDMSAQWTAVAQRYWRRAGVADKIELHIAPAIATLDQMLAAGAAGEFDFIFIDADKTGYRAYYERSLKLVRTGGLVVFDNTLWSGAVADESDQSAETLALRELNEMLHADERVALSLLSFGDGLTLALKR
jgi:predicted O-methyltransferase YrrM